MIEYIYGEERDTREEAEADAPSNDNFCGIEISKSAMVCSVRVESNGAFNLPGRLTTERLGHSKPTYKYRAVWFKDTPDAKH